VQQILFPSPSTKTVATCFVYTPPDYNKDQNKRFRAVPAARPGARMKRPGALRATPSDMDNLIAEGKIKPFMIVMTYGNDQ